MARPMLPVGQRRTEPIYVLLRPREKAVLKTLSDEEGKSLGAVVREAFLKRYRRRFPRELSDP
jgi:hypothetical protein